MSYRIGNQRGISSPLVIGVLLFVILAASVVFVMTKQSKDEERVVLEQTTTPTAQTVPDSVSVPPVPKASEPDPSSNNDEGEADTSTDVAITPFVGTVLAGSSSLLLDYKKADYDLAVASNKLVVLYFYANWCPVCKQEVNTALYPAFDGLTRSDIVGFRVHFNDDLTTDTERALAKQYNVGYQHTKVFIKNGKSILTSSESWTKDRYTTEFSTALSN